MKTDKRKPFTVPLLGVKAARYTNESHFNNSEKMLQDARTGFTKLIKRRDGKWAHYGSRAILRNVTVLAFRGDLALVSATVPILRPWGTAEETGKGWNTSEYFVVIPRSDLRMVG